MRTTFDLPDSLVTTLKVRATQEGKRMRELVEEALTEFLYQPSPSAPPSPPFPTLSVGKVLVAAPENAREELYEDRGTRY